MKKAFEFVESLSKPFLDLMGFPTIKVYSEITEVVFKCDKVIRTLVACQIPEYDEVRFYADSDCIMFVFTFNNAED